MTPQVAFDPYRVLGIPRDALLAAIKAAHRKRAKQTHPDTGGDARAFADVSRAVQILSDPARRARFDQTGDADDKSANNQDAEANGIIAGLLQSILQADQEPPTQHDLIAAMVNSLNGAVNQIKAQRSRLNRVEMRAKALAKRFRRKARGEPNLIVTIMESQVRDAKITQVRMDAGQRAHERAIVILADYAFEKDAAAPQFFSVYTAASGSTSTF